MIRTDSQSAKLQPQFTNDVQDAEKVRQRRSRKTRPPHRLGGVHKRAARYSARREPQRLTAPQEYDSPQGHWALTDSRPSADVTLILLRVADLAAALLDSLFTHPAVTAKPIRHRSEL